MRFTQAGGVLAACMLLAAVCASERVAAGESPDRPNVVVIMSDDQDQGSLAEMPVVRSRIAGEGASFPDAITTFPLCCPSRATFLTGQYPHNNGVTTNGGPNGGFNALDSSDTLAVWLEDAGYYTIEIGKYLNGYEGSGVLVPEGWSEWHGAKDAYLYYGYKLFEDGVLVQYGDEDEDPDDPADPASYQTDVYTDKAVQAIVERSPAEQPFFLWLNYLAPHQAGESVAPDARCAGAAHPAVRHWSDYESTAMPRPPAFNEGDLSDKPPIVRRLARLTPAKIAGLEVYWRCHRETLKAVDEGVGEVLDALEAAGELERTLVVYVSDNGLTFGQHRLLHAKRHPYEESIGVPMAIRGPGIPAGVTVRDTALVQDLATTILDVTNTRPGRRQDALSLIPFTRRPRRELGRDVLLRGPQWSGLRNSRYTYVRRGARVGGGVELYDRRVDPFQLRSVHSAPRYARVRKALNRRLAALRDCAGPTCVAPPRLRMDVDGAEFCGGGKLTVRVGGADADALTVVVFRRGTRVLLRDGRRPFRLTIRAGQLAGLVARAELLDGRAVTLSAREAQCRPT